MKHRIEQFGGIIAADDPPFLAFVDRNYMRSLGLTEADIWTGKEEISTLSAPVEVHFACTNKCSLGCSHCYMDSRGDQAGDLSAKEFKKSLGILAEMGVFHVALGGGEALEREDLFELAAYARDCGLVPNLTSNGQLLTPEISAKMKIFGQVNLSLDGVGKKSGVFRSKCDFESIDRAFSLLLDADVSTGINCVLGKDNYDSLPELFAYAAEKGLKEIELLRFKPSGRAKSIYQEKKTTYEQNCRLLPDLQGLIEKHDLTVKIDCSFLPMLCYQLPPRDLLQVMGVCGCEAGNYLLGVLHDGQVCACSFLPSLGIQVDDLPEKWPDNQALEGLRNWHLNPPQPCADCDYLDICKGGCHAVALAVSGKINAPDPDCPWMVESK